MITNLPPAVATRLVKICGLLGSAHDGEVVAAARQATKLLQSSRLTWAELIEPIVLRRPSPSLRARKPPPPADWRAAVAVCLQHPKVFTSWECQFLSNLQSFRRLSAKQTNILARLYAQLWMATGDAP
jgi:hypothetical protein